MGKTRGLTSSLYPPITFLHGVVYFINIRSSHPQSCVICIGTGTSHNEPFGVRRSKQSMDELASFTPQYGEHQEDQQCHRMIQGILCDAGDQQHSYSRIDKPWAMLLWLIPLHSKYWENISQISTPRDTQSHRVLSDYYTHEWAQAHLLFPSSYCQTRTPMPPIPYILATARALQSILYLDYPLAGDDFKFFRDSENYQPAIFNDHIEPVEMKRSMKCCSSLSLVRRRLW